MDPNADMGPTESGTAGVPIPKKRGKRQPPFSIRLSSDEKAALQKAAGATSLGSFVRRRIFEGLHEVQTRTRNPVIKDREALGRVLAELGASHLSRNLNQLAKAVHTGTLPATPETQAAIQSACAAIESMRQALLHALGLSAGGRS